ncbi:hypothetical protein [Streptomyces sp. ODS28]|uniref:hypothetical protein n=1 Tax=Streptomyces sp. ODS28 TaxID=3136688 RepID=UPI0031EEF4CB
MTVTSPHPTWRTDWRHYLTTLTISISGGAVSTVALPLIAVTVLDASVWQAALLTAAQRLPPLFTALLAGAVVDRYRRLPLLISGGLLARRLVPRRGPFRVMLAGALIAPAAQLPLLLSVPGLTGQIAIGAGLAFQLGAAVATGSTQRSVRQLACDSGMQGRQQAVGTWLAYGPRSLAALAAGALATAVGARPALALAAALLLVPPALLLCSPVRRLRTVPAPRAAP